MADSNKLRIAVTGGGLAGAAIANALFRQLHLDVHIYESALEFSERGQAIGLAINAQRALARLLPDDEAVLQRAGAVTMHSTRIIMGSGPAAGTEVIDFAEENPGKTIHRAALLHELLAPMPPEIMHANKKLSIIEEHSNTLVLHFTDGSTAETDALIGADGLFGCVRSHVLGADHPSTKPVAAGWTGTRNLIPYDIASKKLGSELFQEDRVYGWIGEGGLFMHNVLNDGKMVQCMGSSIDRNPSSERRRSIDRQHLEDAFSTWLNGPIATKMIDLLLDQESPAVFAQWEHRDASSYVKGNVCVAGDAAHAMTPWQGSGGAMALEDAVVLGALLAQVHSRSQIADAFRAYDAIRRPRTQHIAASSRLTGRIMTGLVPEIGTDPEKLRAALKDRWEYIYDFDLDKHVDEAVSLLQGRSIRE
ncbi:MAG: hypothetical protein Q9227_009221 [Pyrenula ochraceoflavens]